MIHHLSLDHLVVAVPDLAAACAALSGALGATPVKGGSHPDYGTCNALISLGASAYLELLGPDPSAVAGGPWARRAAAQNGPDIWAFAVATNDQAGVAARAKAMNLEVQGPSVGWRTTPSGQLLRWKSLFLLDPLYAGLVPFVIDWMDTPHPGRTSGPPVTLTSMIVTHPRPERLRTLYAGLGLELEVHHGSCSSIVVTIENGARISTWVGSAAGLFPTPGRLA